MSAESTNVGGGEAIKLLSDALHEAVAMLKVDPEADAPGSDLYTWLRITPRIALDAALSAQSTGSAGVAAEPVAWGFEAWKRPGDLPVFVVSVEKPSTTAFRHNIRPLYEHPPVAAAPTPPAVGEATEAGQRAYAGYCSAIENDPDRQPVLTKRWADLSLNARECWAAAAKAVSISASPEPAPASPAGDLISLSAGATPGEASFAVEAFRIPECDDADLPGILRIGNVEIAQVHEKYGPGVTPRYETDGAFIAALWNAYRSGRLVEAAPAAPRKGQSASDLIQAIHENVSSVTGAGGVTWVDYTQVQEVITAFRNPADRGETQAVGDGLDAERFRALMRCGRIKMQGSAGVDPKTGKRTYPDEPGSVHFGAEFWVQPEAEPSNVTIWGRHCLRALADDILALEASSPDQNRGEPDQGGPYGGER